MEASETVPRRRGNSRLILESALIVLSVFLGFALSNWAERSADRKLAAAAIDNFRREIESNLAQLERVQPKHAQFAKRLEKAAVGELATQRTAFDSFFALMPEGGLD